MPTPWLFGVRQDPGKTIKARTPEPRAKETSMKKLLPRALAVALILVSLSPRMAESQTAQGVVDRYVQAIGGYTALDNIQTIQYDRILTHIEESRVIHTRVYHARPHRYRIEYPNSGSFRVVNGERAWSGTRDQDTGVSEWEEIDPWSGTDFEQRLGLFINYEEKGYGLDFVGTITKEGRELHHLTLNRPGSTDWHLYFDAESGLFRMFEPAPGTTITLHDYREAGGILVPHLTEGRGVTPQGTEFHHLNSVTNLVLNGPMDEHFFTPPAKGISKAP